MNMACSALWIAAGKLAGKGEKLAVCRICGLLDVGLLFVEWARPTFTDWDKLQAGGIICHACQFAFAECSELLAQRTGKDKPQRMRNYSHFVLDDEWLPLSKADKVKMTHLLLYKSPQIAVIAESGQKHIIFRAKPGVVQFEEHQILDWQNLGSLLNVVEKLYGTFSKVEIGTGNYAQHRVMKFGISSWNGLENIVKPQRQTSLFSLALFLAQRKENIGQIASEGSGVTRCDMARSPEQLQIPLSAFNLATV